jgi:LmbE family N-acetylglucosaminyl deacetylase
MPADVGMLGSILGIWAHPDDEAYLTAGVMAMAVDAGQPVACITATYGDAGETADPSRWPRERLPQIRRKELARSLVAVGVTDHHCLDLPDGQLATLDPAGPIARLDGAIERLRPDTVVTFGPDGMTGHPDHTAVSGWVTTAVSRAEQDTRLLFATKTAAWVEEFRDVSDVIFPDGLPPLTPENDIVGFLLDDDVLARKVRALEAHASQTTGLMKALGRDRFAECNRLEAFREAVG